MMSKKLILTEKKVQSAILFLRGKRIVIDADLAAFYQVPTKVFNQGIRRNIERFPDEFMFRLNKKEKKYVVTNCDHLNKLKFSSQLPYAFTEHGVVMAANVLNSQVAVQASIQIVKVFIRVSEVLLSHKELAAQIEKLERKFGDRLDRQGKELNILF